MSKELVISATRHETRVATLEDDRLVEVAIERASEHALAGNIYKGRVSRVLPGMQSAFVKIGLERDAFLYVSDVLDETAEIESGASDQEGDEIGANSAQPPANRDEAEETAEAPQRGRRGDRRGRGRGRGGRGRDGRRGDEETRPEGENAIPGEAPADETAAEASVGERNESGPGEESSGRRERRSRRGRRRRGRGGRDGGSRFPGGKFASSERDASEEETPRRRPAQDDETDTRIKRAVADPRDEDSDEDDFQVLPGESLAKYGARGAEDEDDDIEYEGDEAEDVAEATDSEEDAAEGTEYDEEDSADDGASEDEDDGPDVDEDASEEETADEDESHDEEPDDEDDDSGEDGDSDDEDSGDEYDDVSDDEDSDDDSDDEDSDDEDDDDSGDEESREEESDSNDPSDADETEEAGERPAEQAEVRERGGSRNLRRGRRGRRRGGRGRRDSRAGEGRNDETQVSPDRDGAKRAAAEPESTPEPSSEHPSIADLLKPGQEVIVQVAKEPLGKKGARITSHVALPGRHLVYMPTVAHVGVSRKIGSDAERARLPPGNQGSFRGHTRRLHRAHRRTGRQRRRAPRRHPVLSQPLESDQGEGRAPSGAHHAPPGP